jgi:hypothetical protein
MKIVKTNERAGSYRTFICNIIRNSKDLGQRDRTSAQEPNDCNSIVLNGTNEGSFHGLFFWSKDVNVMCAELMNLLLADQILKDVKSTSFRTSLVL